MARIYRFFIFTCAIFAICTIALADDAQPEHDPVLPAESVNIAQNAPVEPPQPDAASANQHHYDENEKNHEVVKDAKHLVQHAKGLADSSLTFWHAFVASLSVIIVSELGDKTWFIAVILAMRHSRLTVFMGAISALGVMTALSAGLGWATQIIPKAVTFYVSTALFALFGLKMLKEAYDMSPNEGQEEYEEAQEEINKREGDYTKKQQSESLLDVEAQTGRAETGVRAIFKFVSGIYVESFTLTFLAEWGDRSQITTIILAAREDVFGVTIGGILGHAICTGIAVIGGRLIAQRISVRTVTFVGGIVFIIFALSAFFINPEDA